MRRAVATALVALMLVTAGCNGVLDSGNSTDGGPANTVTPTATPEPTATTPQTPTPTAQEQEYLKSGKEFTRVLAVRLHEVHGTYIYSRDFYRNNTVELTYRLSEGTPLYKSMMNATQTVSAIVGTRTTDNESEALQNGVNGKVHRPETVYINIIDQENQTIGTFEINPQTAYRYRIREFDADVFAQNVVNTLELEQEVERGDRKPGWYLNRSQLYDWAHLYAAVLRYETDPSKTVYKKEFPVDNITIKPGEMRVHHEMVWDKEEMGQAFISGEADMHTAYRMTTNASWAMAPDRLSHYMHRPGIDDVRGHMDLESVLWIITHRKNNTNLNTYLNMAVSEGVDDE